MCRLNKYIWAMILWLMWVCNVSAITVLRDAQTEHVVNKIAQDILEAAGLTQRNIQIVLYYGDDVNAFVLDNNHIFVSSAVLLQYDDPEVLAGILSHESGHIVANHLLLRRDKIAGLSKSQLLTMIVGIGAALASGDVSPMVATAVVSSHVSGADYLRFSRNQEREADNYSVSILKKLGIRTAGMETLLGDFAARDRMLFAEKQQYFLTHPMSRERLQFIQSSSIANNFYFSEQDKHNYKRAVDRLKIIMNANAKKEQTDPYLQAIQYLQNRHYDEALAILRTLDTDPYVLEDMARAHFGAGNLVEALKSIESAYQMDKQSPMLKLDYAMLLIEVGGKRNYHKAVQLLESLLLYEDDNHLIWRSLGISYEKTNRRNNAFVCYAYENYYKGNARYAERFLAKAQQNADLMDASYAQRSGQLQQMLKEKI